MEEIFWVVIPIAVAVLGYLLDVRAARRHEQQQDETKARMRTVELAHVAQFGDVDKSLAIIDKTLEHVIGRVDALEGIDGGVPKEHGEAIVRELQDMRTTLQGLAVMHHNLADNHTKLAERVDGIEGDDEA